MSISFPTTEYLHKLWGGLPGPRPTPRSAFSRLAKSESGGTRADQGVRPTIYAGFSGR
jgi:hypothetical protein